VRQSEASVLIIGNYIMKGTRNKEEYRRASAIKQKLEGLPYRTIAKNLDVNYRNVYNWIKEYKEYGLERCKII
jgi:transposase